MPIPLSLLEAKLVQLAFSCFHPRAQVHTAAPLSGRCGEVRTHCLRLIKPVLIRMSFTPVCWSTVKGSNLRSSAPKADAIPLG